MVEELNDFKGGMTENYQIKLSRITAIAN